MTVTTTKRVRIRWAARRDLIAHAHRPGNVPRTLCGLPAIEERDNWQDRAVRQCMGCEALVAELEGRLV